MAIKTEQRGFALLIAVIFMSVMLTFGLALGSLGYKQQVLASSSIRSQYAFYAADAALECALHADQQENRFAYPTPLPTPLPVITCDGRDFPTTLVSYIPSQWVIQARISLDSNTRCADVTLYKPSSVGTTYIFSQGHDVSCATVASPNGARFVSRGLDIKY